MFVGIDFVVFLFYNVVLRFETKTNMLQFTQNNKIAVAAVSIFLVSFVSMLVFMDSEPTSPDFVKSDVLSSTLSEKEGGHHVYFSEGSEPKENTKEDAKDGSNKETETSSHESNTNALEESYRELTNQDTSPIFVLEPSGKTKFLSENFMKDYGYELEEMSEDSFFSYIDGEDLPDFVSAYTDILNLGKAKNGIGPYRFKNKDGTFSIQVTSMLPVIDENEKVSEVIGYVKDITSVLKSFAIDVEDLKVEDLKTDKEETSDDDSK